MHLTPQGEVVFNYEYCGSVKLDQCGGLIWKINKPTHHSVVAAESGGYWVLGRFKWLASEEPDRFPPYSTPAADKTIDEDTLLRTGEDGKILEESSIPMILRENNLEALLTASGASFHRNRMKDRELVHANKAVELPSTNASTFPLFAAGDLAISLREHNLIIVLDPVTKKIKWRQTGPWLRQHDPEFRSDRRISIFNNNVYRTAYIKEKTVLSTPYKTNIIAVDPVSRETEVLFGGRPSQEMLSVIRGQHELLENDGILITEFDAGRVMQVDAEGQIIWEYVNGYDDDFVGEVANAHIYSTDYFQTEWENCS